MKLKYIVWATLFLIVLNSCSETEDLGEKRTVRTVLVYMVASTNLGGDLQRNIANMTAVATPENLNGGHLIVFYSESKEKAELFEIKEDESGVITRHPIRDYENKSAISPQVMREIIRDVVDDYPADSYGMILSSHGSAWLPTDFRSRLRSFGEEDKECMEINELASALDNHFFDFLLFDACSMGSIECVYELRNKAEYIISSPSEIWAPGFPYSKIAPMLFQDAPEMNRIVDEFHDFYLEYQYPYGNVSVVKTDQLEELSGVARTIVSTAGGEEATSNLPLPDLQILTSLSGSPTKLYDLGDVIRRLATEEQYTRFQASLDKTITEKRYTTRIYCQGEDNIIPVEAFSGLSVYPLRKELTELNGWYRQLDWYKAVYE